ncbi:hypothetical protein Hte_005890 [Hypoxylon texense]
MDFVNKLTGGSKDDQGKQQQQQQQQQKQGNEQKTSNGGIMDKLNGMAGGGRESEKNEDALDKGDQSNESAVEQAKDEQISDFIREKTGIPIKDKERF